MGTEFQNNHIIKAFHELAFFTSVTIFGSNIFRNSSLEHITIPVGVTSIGTNALYWVARMRYIICLPTTPPTLSSSSITEFYGNIYVPDEVVSEYSNDSSWSATNGTIKPLSQFNEVITVYKGIIDRARLYTNSSPNPGTVEAYWPCCISNWLPVTPGDRITVYQGHRNTESNAQISIYNSDKEYFNYWNLGNELSRTVIIIAGAAFIRVTHRWAWLDDVYILNNTTGEYLFKGVNVP